jgi:hypothetical protein
MIVDGGANNVAGKTQSETEAFGIPYREITKCE